MYSQLIQVKMVTNTFKDAENSNRWVDGMFAMFKVEDG